MGDKVWKLHKELLQMMPDLSKESKPLFEVVIHVVAKVGSIEDRITLKKGDARRSFNEWAKDNGQFP